MSKVLIAVDASEQAERAFNWYLKNFHKDDNQILIVHVRDIPKLPTFSFTEVGSFPADEISKIMVENNKKVAEVENRYSVLCTQQKIKHKISIRSGNPGEEIVDAAKADSVDVVVMGTRGLGTIRRTVLGSVSDYVIHHIKIPVLIVPKL